MATEDLTGTKYINSLVRENPVESPGDTRQDGDEHLRGIKNCIKKSFPNITGACTATAAELNFLVGKTTVAQTFPADTGIVFYNASAPTGWTQETALSGLDGCMIRMVTSWTAATAGTDDVSSPPSADHSHTDTLAMASHAVTINEMGQHSHDSCTNNEKTSQNRPNTTEYMAARLSNGGSQRDYDMDQNSGFADVGESGNAGAGTGHSHTITGAIGNTSPTITQFAPKYHNAILCIKD